MSGTMAGERYRVSGWSVLGEAEGGQVYYWHEFNLAADSGRNATLVYEVTEQGPQWRFFTVFEPECPITAADAASKRVGDPLNLDGTPVRVTLVSESCVYHVEGAPPEDVGVGDKARYFNAEGDGKMQVVSWTGEEVECYEGTNLARGVVAAAFGLSSDAAAIPGGAVRLMGGAGWAEESPEHYDSLSRFAIKAVAVLLIGAAIFGGYSLLGRGRLGTPTKISAPAAPLTLGSQGTLDGKRWRVTGHLIVEMAEVGGIYDRHEYRLLDEEGNGALLACGLRPGGTEWGLFRPVNGEMPLTPQGAAAKRTGETVSLDGQDWRVGELFQATVRKAEYAAAQVSRQEAGDYFFGFMAQSGSTPLMARWNSRQMECYRGQAFSAQEAARAFGPPLEK